MRAKRLSAILLSAAMVGTLFPYAVLAVDDAGTGTETGVQTVALVSADNYNLTVSEPTTLVVSGNVTLSGTGDAFDINADTTLVFDQGATLTLSGYTNGFVVESLADSQVTVSTEEMDITASSQMDVFRLRDYGALSLTGDNTITGSGTSGTTNRAIVLEGNNSEHQQVTLAANSTLTATNFYRGMETGGAKNYIVSGADMDSSIFDFSDNNCGIALSYFDQNATFEDCKLEVSDCTASGIFMRQDNAALDGLYLTRVNINCVNDINLNQEDIAIRFHSNNFEITDSVINIENAWNTGLWIYDGWNANPQNEITGTTITVKHVEDNSGISGLFGTSMRRKAMTFVPYRDWLIDECTFIIDGQSSTSTGNNEMEGGINIGSDISLNRNSSINPNDWIATPGMHGGKIIFENTTITTSGITGADVGAQVGQWIEIGDNVVIENGSDESHYTVICDDLSNGYPVKMGFWNGKATYNSANMSEANKSPDRLIVTGGSYWSTRVEDLPFDIANVPYSCSVPVNEAGEDLNMFTVTSTAFQNYTTDGKITLMNQDGTTYEYYVENASSDGNRYIWAPVATVTFGEGGQTVTVPRGASFGLTGTLPAGTWMYNGEVFDASTVVTGDITVTAQS